MILAIDISQLYLRWDSQVLYDNLSLQVAAGEKVALTGRSGAGKSSLLQCLMGFLPAAGGVVRVDGIELDSRSAWQVRRRVAYVAQEPRPGSGAVRQVMQQPLNYRANRHLRLEPGRLNELLERFELPRDIVDKTMDDLSGGEKQRICIIMAIVLERAIWLLDEPTSALDRQSKGILRDYLQAQPQLTVLMVTHDPELTAAAGRIVDLADLQGGGAV